MRYLKTSSPRRTRALVAASLAMVSLLVAAGSASAFSISEDSTAPWPMGTITYYDASAYPASVSQAVRSWNSKRTGYRFRRVRDQEAANVLFLTTDARARTCTGSTIHGFNFSQGFVILNGACDRHIMTLGAAHELGHVITLGHENETCAVMNSRLLANRVNSRLARPQRCRRGPQYWRSPVRSDDRRGAIAARRRPFSFPVALCYERNGDFQSQMTANELLCNFQYDCRDARGTAPNAVVSDEFLTSRGCEREEFDRGRMSRSAAAREMPRAKHRHDHSAGEPRSHRFGTSPGVEVFGYAR